MLVVPLANKVNNVKDNNTEKKKKIHVRNKTKLNIQYEQHKKSCKLDGKI